MYRYAKAAPKTAYRSGCPLTNDEIAQYAPSVMAVEPHESCSPHYALIPTIDVLNALREEGFDAFEVRQTIVRDESRRNSTKHMVRLRHPDTFDADGDVPEIVLLNSHDGSCSYQIISGFFRFVCSNGLIAGDVCKDIRVRHSGDVINDVIEGATLILEDLKAIENEVDEYKAIQLKQPEQIAFADAASQVRWGDVAPVESAQLLSPRRKEDCQLSLWTTYNTIQENVLQGGLSGKTRNGRHMYTGAVSGVTENVRLNRALWTLTAQMAKIKAA
jgi:Domain of unknown function (DUF932)